MHPGWDNLSLPHGSNAFGGSSMKFRLGEIIKIATLAVAYFAYMYWLSRGIAADMALAVNFLIAPFVVGVIAYVILRSNGVARVAIAAGLTFVIQVIFFGAGDVAKPGAQYVVAATASIVSLVGATVMAGVAAAFERWARRPKGESPRRSD